MFLSTRNFALVLAVVHAAGATEQIRSRSLTQCGAFEQCYLVNDREHTKVEIHPGKATEYHPGRGYKIICETDAETSDGYEAGDRGKWINLISCYDGKVDHPPTNGHYPLTELAEDWGAPWECGHGQFEDKFEMCDSFYITFVGELYADHTNCDAKVFYFTCPEVPAPTPKPVPPPTPMPAKRCPHPEDVFHPIQKCKSSGKGDKIEWETEKDRCLPDDFKVQIFIPCSGKSYSFSKSDHKDWDCEKGKFEIFDKQIQAELVACKEEQAFHLSFLDGDDCPGISKKCRYTPIALDLDGSGAVERMIGHFEIDITGDGEYEALSQWFAPTEGILVDISQQSADGSISGVQLFGDEGGNYADGFEKLATHDDDGNGIVEGKELDGMAIWVDANSNAKLDDGELSALKDHKIVGLVTSNDNLVSYAILEDGSEMVMEDLFFFR